MNALVPKINIDGAHTRPARHLDRLMLVHGRVRLVIRNFIRMEAVARAILHVKAQNFAEVNQVRANHRRAAMAIALPVEGQLTNSAGSGTARMHNFLFAHIVCNEVQARANCPDCLQLELESLFLISCVRKVKLFNDRLELVSHLKKFGFLCVAFGIVNQAVFQNNVV